MGMTPKDSEPPTPAEQVVARLDSYSQEKHAELLQAARERIEDRKNVGRT